MDRLTRRIAKLEAARPPIGAGTFDVAADPATVARIEQAMATTGIRDLSDGDLHIIVAAYDRHIGAPRTIGEVRT